MKTKQYKIKLKSISDGEMGSKSSFRSRLAFSKSSLWNKIKEGNLGGTIEVQYGGDYKNVFDFSDYKDMREKIAVFTEPELINEFSQ